MLSKTQQQSIPLTDSSDSVIKSEDDSQTLVDVQDLVKHYDTDAGQVPVLREIQMMVKQGEAVAIKGVSGSGKSTLLHILGGIEKPDSGVIRIGNQDISTLGARQQTSFRAKHIGFVFQFFNLIPTLTAHENVVAGLEPLGGSRKQRDATALEVLDAVGLADHVNKYPSQLSGGQQQRVAIARAIAKKPTLILADEPTGALDSATAHQVLQLLDSIRREYHCAIVVATHDPVVTKYVDRVYQLESGQLVSDVVEEVVL